MSTSSHFPSAGEASESNPYWTAREVAARYRCGIESALRRAKEGKLPSVRLGGRVLFPKAALLALEAKHTSGAA